MMPWKGVRHARPTHLSARRRLVPGDQPARHGHLVDGGHLGVAPLGAGLVRLVSRPHEPVRLCGRTLDVQLPLVGEHDGAVAGALEVRSSLDDRDTRQGRPVWLTVVTRSLAGMRPFSPYGLSPTGTSSSGAARRRSTQKSRDEQVPP